MEGEREGEREGRRERERVGERKALNIVSFPPPLLERPTEYAEHDVYLTESRYHESDKEIKKAKPLKVRRDWK